jgi:hypothetical protein
VLAPNANVIGGVLIAALTVIAIADGRAGLKDLGRRLVRLTVAALQWRLLVEAVQLEARDRAAAGLVWAPEVATLLLNGRVGTGPGQGLPKRRPVPTAAVLATADPSRVPRVWNRRLVEGVSRSTHATSGRATAPGEPKVVRCGRTPCNGP